MSLPAALPKIALVLLTVFVAGYAAIASIVYFKQRSFIYFPSQQIRTTAPGYEIVRLETSDGLNLAAGYRKARAGMPTLLAFHGNGADWQSMAFGLRPIVDRGYGVLALEYRGYQGNPGNPSEQGIYNDGYAALQWLEENGVPDRDVVAVGNSLGSGVAVELASQRRLLGLVLVSPVSSMTRLASMRMPWLPVNFLLRDRYDNLAKLPDVRVPILVLHGEADRVIPFAEGQLLAASNPEAQFVPFANFGHELMYEPAITRALASFLRGSLNRS